jgi:ADP-dependent NAD(P)H-hydrate dehydratase / NAD(P)H-hydrate epimerase
MRLPTLLRQRKPDFHKKNFGHIFILAGSMQYSGAALLCAEGAMRSGAGLVTLGIPACIAAAVIKIKPKEVMLLPLPGTKEGTVSLAAYKKILNFSLQANIVVIGPGLTQNKSSQGLIRKLIKAIRKPLIIDADGLNAIAGGATSKLPPEAIVTPHPGEMARLTGIATAVIQKRRKEVAKNFACRYNSTVVLKGHRTVVAAPDGRIYINTTGNPGMATAGSGDVLTGIIAAFRGQGLDSFNAAKYGVYLHGLAGDIAAKEKTQLSLIASDIIDFLPKAIKISL